MTAYDIEHSDITYTDHHVIGIMENSESTDFLYDFNH